MTNAFTAEQSVIGSMLIDGQSINKVSFLKKECFESHAHGLMFEAMMEMSADGTPVDMINLEEHLGQDSIKVGGFAYMAELAKNTPSSANMVAYADIVMDRYQRRVMAKLFDEAKERLANTREKLPNLLAEVSESIDHVLSAVSKTNVMTIDELIERSLDEMESSNNGVKRGIKTGIPELDDRLGYRDMAFGEVTVIGGLSKNGKTLLANTIISRAQLENDEVGHVFSVEMTDLDMFNAMVSARTGVPSNFYCKQDFYAEKYPNEYPTMMQRWGAAANELRDEMRISIDGEKQVNINYIITKIEKQYMLARSKGKKLKLVMIDHLHRLEFDEGNAPRTYVIHNAVKKLKNIASKLDLSILLLAQLGRTAMNEDPNSHHIEDSAKVRQELQAFVGVRMFRDDGGTYFGIYTDAHRFADSETIFEPAYLKLINGVLRSLPEHEKYWKPQVEK